eukprot:NODE_6308_length_584_cov_55.824299_g5897_i0.p1 GENE.NODE_6308_length_584_cov_55.824299_g5897_i0~~NODE_6308_length_584_cov_55.824299_g5897_i0.p1  ORF type:complete len:126 (+),score=5.89 NODE_6308_length_584_cov_55.824299_g5897_i0:113-490(+)
MWAHSRSQKVPRTWTSCTCPSLMQSARSCLSLKQETRAKRYIPILTQQRSATVPVHVCELHTRSSSVALHAVPPKAAGVMIVRVRCCVPPPQSTVQADQSVHADSTQSAGKRENDQWLDVHHTCA